jgi:hypothetical protein
MALKKHPFNLDGFFEVLGRDGGARGRMAETQVFKDRLFLWRLTKPAGGKG